MSESHSFIRYSIAFKFGYKLLLFADQYYARYSSVCTRSIFLWFHYTTLKQWHLSGG